MTGQFLSVDPELAATNQPYVYTENNPVNHSDPTGEASHYTNAYTWENALGVGVKLIFGYAPLGEFIPYVGGILSGLAVWAGEKFVACSEGGAETQEVKRIYSIRYCQGVEYTIAVWGWDTHIPYYFFVQALNVNHQWLRNY